VSFCHSLSYYSLTLPTADRALTQSSRTMQLAILVRATALFFIFPASPDAVWLSAPSSFLLSAAKLIYFLP